MNIVGYIVRSCAYHAIVVIVHSYKRKTLPTAQDVIDEYSVNAKGNILVWAEYNPLGVGIHKGCPSSKAKEDVQSLP